MLKHILQLTRNIIGCLFIIIGAIGIWSLYPIQATILLLLGISILPALYKLLPFKAKGLPIFLAMFFAVLLICSIWAIPKDSQVHAVFKEEQVDTSVCFVTPTGTRYHYSKKCAGEHAEQIKTSQAITDSYTACGTCVKK